MYTKFLPLALLPALACDVAAPVEPVEFEGASPADLAGPIGKADGSDASVISSQGYRVLQLRGDAAQQLFDILDQAGGLSEASQAGVDYVYGVYTICASNGSAAACNVYSDDATLGQGGYLATVHGPRFASGASELFGALSRAQGIAPSTVGSIRFGEFLCEKSAVDVWCGIENPEVSTQSLTLSFDGLPELGAGFVYEGWLITDDGPVSSGRFEETDAVSFEIDASLAQMSSLFVLTIEPTVGDDPAPSDTHIVAGEFANGIAVLDTVHPAALGSDFTASTGGFILETPSTANIASDYAQGVWFLDPGAGPGASLNLPELPAGWVYEGWVVGDEGPVSTGRFVDPADADRDGGGDAAGPDDTPPFPGQDFIAPPMDLVGATVVLSVEPEPDDSAAPFALKPLAGGVEDAGAGGFQTLGNIATDNVIKGLASFNG